MAKMTGYQLFKQATQRVFRNIDDALAVSGLIWIGAMAIVILISNSTPDIVETEGTLMMTGPQLARSFGVNLTVFLAGIWVAIAWHRFSLLGERPQTLIPPLRLSLFSSYLGKSLLLGVVMFVALIPISIGISLAIKLLGPLAILAVVLAAVFVYYGFLRLSAILPAAALGQTLSLSKAWKASEGCKDTLLQAAILSVLLTGLIQLCAVLVGGGIFGLLVSLLLGWVMLVINVSLLSSIYELVKSEIET
jgi:hypothetical protein